MAVGTGGVSRREFIQSVAAGAVAASLAGGALMGRGEAQGTRGEGTPRPNVLVIFPDQWRRQALSCAGDPVVRTPNLDALAAEGVRFERCYTTNPVCSPARAAIMSGRYPHETGLINNNLLLPTGQPSFAGCMAQAGYRTGYVGKWHLDGPAKPGFVAPGPRRQGFEWFEGFNRGHWYHEPQYFSDGGDHIEPRGFESVYQTDLAIEYMTRHKADPFFLFLAWGPPHMPYRPPDEFDRVRRQDLQWRANVPEEMKVRKNIVKDLCGYYGLCETLDHEVGRLMGFLKQSGLDENTLVLFTADHGDMHGSHGAQHKGHVEEESLGVPLIARLPGRIPAGMVTQELFGLVDLMPSVLSTCGLPIPPAVSGTDRSAVILGEAPDLPPLYCEGRMTGMRAGAPGAIGRPGSYGAWRAIVTNRHKLAVDVGGQVQRLTDLHEDPCELNNLATEPGVAQLREDLLAQLRDIGSATGDPFPGRCTPAPTPEA